ncbi:MAG: DUF397 domain-containing protein [Kineosporiaceae bacterium]
MTSSESPDTDALIWTRPTMCASANCIEVALTSDNVYVRDGKDPEGPLLRFDHEEWRAFRASMIDGQFSTD